MNRRNFLKAGSALALFSIVPSKVLGGHKHVAPSDQLTKGIIGVGGIGRSSYHFTSDERCRLVSVCDVDRNHLQKAVDMAKSKFDENIKAYHDF
ncbi:MAG: gfo/Idh/MocA family oxidoreductase, partial [Muribaculaceae bacterium]|nr:gfo/Idh/MocA family oxidoreductase [Muribaculaceae bacterium]